MKPDHLAGFAKNAWNQPDRERVREGACELLAEAKLRPCTSTGALRRIEALARELDNLDKLQALLVNFGVVRFRDLRAARTRLIRDIEVYSRLLP